MPTFRLTLEYEGTRYHGWQEQQNARSVAGELRRALEEALGPGNPIKELGGAGRTDAGVHALAQAAHLRLAHGMEPAALRRAVNDRLPADIHVLALEAAAAAFHARHSAVSRSYLYQISRRRTALAKRFVWWVKRPLDTRLIAAAVALLPGRHDFQRFCERPGEQPSTVVVMERAEVTAVGSLILCRFVASHFLWKMVRRLTGALVKVGAGELDLDTFAALLAPGGDVAVPGASGKSGGDFAVPGARGKSGGDFAVPGAAGKSGGTLISAGGSAKLAAAAKSASALQPAEWTAPPSGLFLERVLYAGDADLAPLDDTPPVSPVA